MNPYILLAVGLFLLLMEFYLPGAVLGTIGAVLLVLSVFFFSSQSGSPIEILLFIVLMIVGIVGVVKFALWQIRGTKKENTIYLDSDQEGFFASSFDSSLIGKSGIALTDLKPGGYILIEKKKYPAISVSGYLVKDSEVTVLSGQGDSLMVKRLNKEPSS